MLLDIHQYLTLRKYYRSMIFSDDLYCVRFTDVTSGSIPHLPAVDQHSGSSAAARRVYTDNIHTLVMVTEKSLNLINLVTKIDQRITSLTTTGLSVCLSISYKIPNIACKRVSKNVSFWNSLAHLVNDGIYSIDWVCLECWNNASWDTVWHTLLLPHLITWMLLHYRYVGYQFNPQ